MTTTNYVKLIRLANSWRKRGHHEDHSIQRRTDTFNLVREVFQQGECRSFGREMLKTYLQIKHHHNAREDDVRDALHYFDQQGTDARRPGPTKSHTRGEYVTPGPDWLWCCDSHDKFRNFGIKIYAGVDAYSRRI